MPSQTLYAFELAARANIVAGSEETAFARFANCVKRRGSDGKYCKLLKTAILEKEEMAEMSRFEQFSLERNFRAVQGGRTGSR